jgi:hypothetical protein
MSDPTRLSNVNFKVYEHRHEGSSSRFSFSNARNFFCAISFAEKITLAGSFAGVAMISADVQVMVNPPLCPFQMAASREGCL